MRGLPDIGSAEEFIRLSHSKDSQDVDRSSWAAMPLEVWWDLVRNHPEMRHWAAHNRTAPPEILAELTKDGEWRVRLRVAMKRACAPEILDQLATDPDAAVRRRVVEHPRAPRSAIERLTDDSWSVVADAARDRLSHWSTSPRP